MFWSVEDPVYDQLSGLVDLTCQMYLDLVGAIAMGIINFRLHNQMLFWKAKVSTEINAERNELPSRSSLGHQKPFSWTVRDNFWRKRQ